MKKRTLGQGLEVSAVGLGCMGMSQAYGAYDEADSLKTLDRALDLGVNFFDTAEAYGPYRNEELLGRSLASRRAGLVIATKFGFTFKAQAGDHGAISGTDGRPEHAKEVAEASLKRLRLDVIDLYYLHRADPAVPIEDTVGAMADLVRDGKVRALGLSEVSADMLRRAHAVHPIAALQSEYSLWTRDVESNGVLAACRDLGIGFVPFSPLGRGFLTGKQVGTDGLEEKDFRRSLPRFQDENLAANRLLVEAVTRMAEARGVTAAQVALAWVLAQGNDIVPIPGARRIRHLEENVAAADIALISDDLDRLNDIFAPGKVAGARYPEAFEKLTKT
ncbi:aldo/keto reductase [Pararhodospirillum oryzae]|uniref:Aldo/keto reductase n=1 Tax=Pararhodospirillum oryzae TaxID=478448 RepID=A0A512H6J6_9PROT|nr:aldo/keto reductase [Pararhodospirillum oryzae]GEO81067.1 aldo/keto reductase [Pararhodospirillum oryzae]